MNRPFVVVNWNWRSTVGGSGVPDEPMLTCAMEMAPLQFSVYDPAEVVVVSIPVPEMLVTNGVLQSCVRV